MWLQSAFATMFHNRAVMAEQSGELAAAIDDFERAVRWQRQAYEQGFEDMPRRVPDLSKLRALIGYEPQVHLDEILDRVIDHFTSAEGRL